MERAWCPLLSSCVMTACATTSSSLRAASRGAAPALPWLLAATISRCWSFSVCQHVAKVAIDPDQVRLNYTILHTTLLCLIFQSSTL